MTEATNRPNMQPMDHRRTMPRPDARITSCLAAYGPPPLDAATRSSTILFSCPVRTSAVLVRPQLPGTCRCSACSTAVQPGARRVQCPRDRSSVPGARRVQCPRDRSSGAPAQIRGCLCPLYQQSSRSPCSDWGVCQRAEIPCVRYTCLATWPPRGHVEFACRASVRVLVSQQSFCRLSVWPCSSLRRPRRRRTAVIGR